MAHYMDEPVEARERKGRVMVRDETVELLTMTVFNQRQEKDEKDAIIAQQQADIVSMRMHIEAQWHPDEAGYSEAWEAIQPIIQRYREEGK